MISQQIAPAGRFAGIERPYGPEEVARLRGSVAVEHSLARRGAERLWQLLRERDYVHALRYMPWYWPAWRAMARCLITTRAPR